MSNTTVSHAPPLVLAELLERCMGSPRVAHLLLSAFEAHTPQDIRALEAALTAGDGPGAACLAHALKGAASTIAAHRLSRQAACVEASARADRLDEATRELHTLREHCARCIDYLPAARSALQRTAGAEPSSAAVLRAACPDTAPRPEDCQ